MKEKAPYTQPAVTPVEILQEGNLCTVSNYEYSGSTINDITELDRSSGWQ